MKAVKAVKKVFAGAARRAEELYLWRRHVFNGKNDFGVPFWRRLYYALKGFDAHEIVWYNLEKNDCREYISDHLRLKSRKINGSFKYILDDKIVFEEIFRRYAHVPENYVYLKDGCCFGLHGRSITAEGLLPFLRGQGKTVLKRVHGGGGEGTCVIQPQGETDFLVNGKTVAAAQLQKQLLCKGEAFVCEYMQQSPFADSLYPHAANTIRMVCAKKKGEQTAHVIAAVQRVGTDASAPTDNVSMGGLSCEIDLETGTLSAAIAKLGKMENRMIPFDRHPDTGGQLQGRVIPGWAALKQQVEAVTNALPYLNFVAWDVLLLPDGGFCLIEGNASSGCGLFQLRHGVKNGAIGDIYRSYGII